MHIITTRGGSGPTWVSAHQLQELWYLIKIPYSAQSASSLRVWEDEKSQDCCSLNQRLVKLLLLPPVWGWQVVGESAGGFDRSAIWPLWTAAVWEDSWTLWTTHSLMVPMLKRCRTGLRDPVLACSGCRQVTGVRASFHLIRSSQGHLGCHLLSPFLCGQHLLPRGFPPTAVVPTGLLKRRPWTETQKKNND